jgi:hypothetical protein
VTDVARDGMFALREVHPALKGQWIIAMREPLARGLACLRASLEGCRYAVFDHVTEYDYDGVMTSIGQVAGFRDRVEAEAHAGQRCDEIVGSFQVEDRWNVNAGRILGQCGGVKAGHFRHGTVVCKKAPALGPFCKAFPATGISLG